MQKIGAKLAEQSCSEQVSAKVLYNSSQSVMMVRLSPYLFLYLLFLAGARDTPDRLPGDFCHQAAEVEE